MFIPNPELRERFTTAQAAQSLPGMSPFGITATIAAYNEGEPWLDAVMAYITDNAKLVMDTFAAQEPRVKPIMPQGTYLNGSTAGPWVWARTRWKI